MSGIRINRFAGLLPSLLLSLFIVGLFIAGLLMTRVTQAKPLQLTEVAPDVYALIGPMEQRSAQNLANNANFGFIVTHDSVLLIDSGGTLLGAGDIESHIRTVTDKPIQLVINTGGQDHRWFGNRYFAEQGIRTLTSVKTQADQNARRNSQIESTSALTAASWAGTDPQPATAVVSETTELTIGGLQIELIPVGPAHTGGETLVWLPEHKVLFSGDLVYTGRMLGIGPQSQHRDWIAAFDTIRQLAPQVIVPGHGQPTDLSGAEKDTYDYLVFLRSEVGRLIDAGEEMSAVSRIDQSRFSYLEVYEQIHGRNAQQVFEQMEWE
ncbi:MBL fold metallo-hydrolase [Amphritea balenae]|uniref:MBL fold metallo-hydrolase n=1 Tax=Amphritea balenae TaxID=452629 RepID=A0A3P1STS2_9GAMM|nr:MBL fold metallo-hydrolase [Amphritea balenae]RRD00480.1 MBL fold metallo-hydrolase [Amphritea balenae]GGK70409.1 MBL fold metallo-hydrolase [Amphritea balenae]